MEVKKINLYERFQILKKADRVKPVVLDIDIDSYENRGELFIDEYMGRKISSGHNQHMIAMIVGKTGEGKSRAALYIGYVVACYLAERLGGVWEDYFGIDNIAIIKTEEVLRVMKNNKKFNVIVLDDIGVSWGARDWQDKFNKLMGKIFMTFRTMNNLVLLTIPDNFMADKNPRNLLHTFIEMDEQFFDQGITTFKIFNEVKKYRIEKIFHVRPRLNNIQYPIGCINNMNIPETLINEYEEKRDLFQRELSEECLKELEELQTINDSDDNKTKDIKKQLQLDKAFAVHEMSTTKGVTVRDACKMINIGKDTYYNIKKAHSEMFSLSV